MAEVLKKDLPCQESKLTWRNKWNLIQSAKQSLSRLAVLLGPSIDGKCDHQEAIVPSAPPESHPELRNPTTLSPPAVRHMTEESIMMARYQRRLGLASSVVERQNIELEMARKLVEKSALSRNNLVSTTAWAMQNAHKKFQIQEKLTSGKLKESDLRKQQLYTISIHFNEGNLWLTQLAEDLAHYPTNEKVVRELLDNVLTDNSHPIKATINHMQDKVNSMVTDAMINVESASQVNMFDNICKVVKEDVNIIQEVLKALFEPLKTERNSFLTSEAVYHVYFSQIKPALISLIKIVHKDVKEALDDKIKTRPADGTDHDGNNWCGEAVSKLHYLTTLHNPYDMLDCTVHIIKLLATCKFDQQHCTSIGADDLLPRLCQVVVSSGMPSIYAETYFMEAFMPSEKALGEEGYAVTMLQSAIAHLTMS